MIQSRRFLWLLASRAALGVGLAGFLAAGFSDVTGAHGCAHHDAMPLAAGAVADVADHAVEQADAPADTHHDGGPCTCVGGACAAASAFLAQSPPVDLRFSPDIVRSHAPARFHSRTPVREPYLQPFANAPPIA